MITMFKDDSKNIEQMLESVSPHIDYWVLQDNGSVDGSPEIVKRWAEKYKIPGKMYTVEEGWINFAVNQDYLLQTALEINKEINCDWIMKMDPNEMLEIDEEFDWTLFSNSQQCYQVAAFFNKKPIYRGWIWNARLPWKFENTLDNQNISLNDQIHGENFDRKDLPPTFRMLSLNTGIRVVKRKPKPVEIFDLVSKKYVKPAKICMISMFKNEAENIRSMLDSVAPYISYWVLQDNGSTDGTPDIVKKWAEETKIPGHLYQVEEGWVNFGWNRDHLLQTTQKLDHGCDWIMKMDCDETLEVDDDFDWTPFSGDYQSFHVTAKAPGVIYFRAWIWRAGLPWRFNHDPAHETISLDDGVHGEDFIRTDLPKSFRMIAGMSQGESYSVPTKYVSDALKLEEKLIREGTMLTDLYHFWYIGKSYEDCYRGDFFPLKDLHQEEYARRCIFYFKSLVNHKHPNFIPRHIDEMAYYAICALGNASRFLKKYDDALEYYNMAEPFSPGKNDHLACLAELYWEKKDFRKMLEYATLLNDPRRVNPFPNYHFLINPNLYVDTRETNYIIDLYNTAIKNINQSNTTSNTPENCNILIVNPNKNKRLFVVDNFYSNPDEVRNFALKQDYVEDLRYYKGNRSAQRYLNNDIKLAFEDIIGRKINVWEQHGMNGKFQYCTPEDQLVYHHDEQNWAAVLYLTPNAPYNTGTCLYAHKESRIRHADEPGCDNICFTGGFYDDTKFDLVDVVGNIYNRVVIFDSRCIHAAQKYFGQTIQDSRLFHLFFFD